MRLFLMLAALALAGSSAGLAAPLPRGPAPDPAPDVSAPVAYRDLQYQLNHGTRSEVVVRAVGQDAAVVRHHYQGAGSFDGAHFTDDQRCVMIWEKQAGEWRLVTEQCSFSSK
jgi:hypothetical protein